MLGGARPVLTHTYLDEVRRGLLFLHPLPLALQLLSDALSAVRRDLLGLAAANLVRRGSSWREIDDLALIWGARILCVPARLSALSEANRSCYAMCTGCGDLSWTAPIALITQHQHQQCNAALRLRGCTVTLQAGMLQDCLHQRGAA